MTKEQIDAEILRLEQEKKDLAVNFQKDLNLIHEKSIKRHDQIHIDFMKSLENELDKIFNNH